MSSDINENSLVWSDVEERDVVVKDYAWCRRFFVDRDERVALSRHHGGRFVSELDVVYTNHIVFLTVPESDQKLVVNIHHEAQQTERFPFDQHRNHTQHFKHVGS